MEIKERYFEDFEIGESRRTLGPHDHRSRHRRARRTASTINPRAMSYGYDRLRFIKPVFIGDTIRALATIKEKRDHPRRSSHGIVVELLEVSNQESENVLVCEHLYLVERREPRPRG
jgi:acyl dehydratase